MAGVAMMLGLTHQQAKLVRYIAARIKSDGVAPSWREMALAMGLRSTSNITRLIEALEKAGVISRGPGRRNLRLVLPNPLEFTSTGDLIAELDRRSALPAYVDTHEGLSA